MVFVLPPPPYSTISVSPREVQLSDSGFETNIDMTFWRVTVNGCALTDTAQTFDASEDRIELLGCTACGAAGCGDGFVSVRRHAKLVVWMNPIPQRLPDGHPGLPPNTIHWFDRDHYRLACRAGDIDQLPRLSSPEFHAILAPSLAPLREALYVDGLDPSPERIAIFFRDFASAIGEKPIEISETDPDFAHLREIGVGLDVKGCPESRFWLARSGDTWRIRCIANPCIPVWFASTALTELLAPFTLTHRPTTE